MRSVLDSQANSNTVDEKSANEKFQAAGSLVPPGAKDGHARLEPKGVNNIETKINKDFQVKESGTDMFANNIHEPEEPDQLMKGNKY